MTTQKLVGALTGLNLPNGFARYLALHPATQQLLQSGATFGFLRLHRNLANKTSIDAIGVRGGNILGDKERWYIIAVPTIVPDFPWVCQFSVKETSPGTCRYQIISLPLMNGQRYDDDGTWIEIDLSSFDTFPVAAG